ncbi:MAG: hypothetical protein ACR2P8_09965, partial [Myxococcota bacterium]
GCSSMFDYCLRVLHFPEAVAYKRIQAARAARRHPGLLEAVHRGELHVTGASLLAPRLTAENRGELIRAATHRSAEEIRRLLADREPKPDVRASVRRLPEPAKPTPRVPGIAPADCEGATGHGSKAEARIDPGAARTHPVAYARPTEPTSRPRTMPLGGERYAVRFTADCELHAQIQELRALLRHQIPDGDVGKILARAVAALLREVRARKFGESAAARPSKPRAGKPTLPDEPADSDPRPPGRHIPAAIRRAVARRDGERCTYLSASGRRCEAREFLEFDHREPWAREKTHSVEGLRLRCRAHNQLAARQSFGEKHMACFRKRSGRGADGSRPRAPAVTSPPSAQLDSNPVHPDSGGAGQPS